MHIFLCVYKYTVKFSLWFHKLAQIKYIHRKLKCLSFLHSLIHYYKKASKNKLHVNVRIQWKIIFFLWVYKMHASWAWLWRQTWVINSFLLCNFFCLLDLISLFQAGISAAPAKAAAAIKNMDLPTLPKDIKLPNIELPRLPSFRSWIFYTVFIYIWTVCNNSCSLLR